MDIAPQILATRALRDKFSQCLGRSPLQVAVVTPYVGETPWGDIVKFSRDLVKRECKVQLITRRPGSGQDVISFDEADELEKLGVDLRIRTQPKLHSKIYQFSFRQKDMAAFVGSANFTAGGFGRNDETVAFLQKKEDNKAVAAEISRLAAAGSVQYWLWRKKPW